MLPEFVSDMSSWLLLGTWRPTIARARLRMSGWGTCGKPADVILPGSDSKASESEFWGKPTATLLLDDAFKMPRLGLVWTQKAITLQEHAFERPGWGKPLETQRHSIARACPQHARLEFA